MFGAIGDAETDYVPLQVGQFESNNRMDDQLRGIALEGNGGEPEDRVVQSWPRTSSPGTRRPTRGTSADARVTCSSSATR
jgi:hypothetical protein